MKKSILLVDADLRSRRLLEVSLRKAGYTVSTAEDADAALATVAASVPDLVVTDTVLPGRDGFALVETLRADAATRGMPVLFLSSDTSLASKVRGLECGVEYLTKPMYIREVLTRVGLELDRASRKIVEMRPDTATRFAGVLADMGLVDLLQTIDVSRKSGTLVLDSGSAVGRLWFRDGQVIDAECGALGQESAIYRLLTWGHGNFEVTFGPVDRAVRVELTTPALLMEGMRRIDEWTRLVEQVPPLDTPIEVDGDKLVGALGSLPDSANSVIRLVDGSRSVRDVIEARAGDDLETLKLLADLAFAGLLRERPVKRAGAADGRWVATGSDSVAGMFAPQTSRGEEPAPHPLTSVRTSGAVPPATPEAVVAGENVIPFPAKDARVPVAATPPAGAEPRPVSVRPGGDAQPTVRVSAPTRAEGPGRASRPAPGVLDEDETEEGFFSAAGKPERVDSWIGQLAPRGVDDSNRVVWGSVALALAVAVLVGCIYFVMRIQEERAAEREVRAPIGLAPLPDRAPVEALPEDESAQAPEAPGATDVSGSVEALPVPVEQPARAEAAAPATEAAPVEGATAPDAPAPMAEEPSGSAVTADAPPPAPGAPTYADLVADGLKFERAGNLKRAEEAFRAALLVDADGADAIEGLAFVLVGRGRNKEAVPLAERAAAAKPTSSKAWITLGAALQGLGKPADARAAYQRCVSEGEGAFVRDCKLMVR